MRQGGAQLAHLDRNCAMVGWPHRRNSRAHPGIGANPAPPFT